MGDQGRHRLLRLRCGAVHRVRSVMIAAYCTLCGVALTANGQATRYQEALCAQAPDSVHKIPEEVPECALQGCDRDVNPGDGTFCSNEHRIQDIRECGE